MIVRFIIPLISLFSTSLFAGTKLPARCEVSLPRGLMNSSISEKVIDSLQCSGDWGQSSTTHYFWTVYSDRSHNMTYCDPSTNSGKFDELTFNEKVRIARIENDFALVYSEGLRGIAYPQISTKAKSRGWIPMKNLLWWDRCLTDECGFYKKALLVANLDEIMRSKAKLGLKYEKPETEDGATELVADMSFYFVMKHLKKGDDDMFLLASECRLEGFTDHVLYGWIPYNSLITINRPIFIEPNWTVLVAENLKGKSVDIISPDGTKASEVRLGRKNGLQNTATQYRWEPELMRFPLLGDNPNNEHQYSIIAFSRPDGYSEIPTLMALQGYTPKKDAQTGFDLWKPVLFLSIDEFKILLETFNNITFVSKTGNRHAFVNFIQDLVLMVSGFTPQKSLHRNEIEIENLMSPLPLQLSFLNGHTLSQIRDEKLVSKDKFNEMVALFAKKYRKLESFLINPYDFSIVRNQKKWYWLPLEDIL